MAKPREVKNVGKRRADGKQVKFRESQVIAMAVAWVESQGWAALRIPDAAGGWGEAETATRFTLPKVYDLGFTAPSPLIPRCAEQHALEFKLVKDSYSYSATGKMLARLKEQVTELCLVDMQGANAFGWMGVNFRQHAEPMSQAAIAKWGLGWSRLWFAPCTLVAAEVLRAGSSWSRPAEWFRDHGIECHATRVLRESSKTPGKFNKVHAWDLTPLLGGGRRIAAPLRVATPLAQLGRKLSSALAPGQGSLFDNNERNETP